MVAPINRVNCQYFTPGRAGLAQCAIGHLGGRPSRQTCMSHCRKRSPLPSTDLVIRNWQGAGDAVELTGTVRDLHLRHPGFYRTAVETPFPELFAHNPFVTPAADLKPDRRTIKVEGFIANDEQQHLIGGFNRALGSQLGVEIELTRIAGDIHLSAAERESPRPFPEPYWLMWAGGHLGLTTKWWNPASHQAVVDHFAGRLRFVQVGAREHWHPPLKNVVNRIGQTSMRELVRLMYHAGGVVSGISFGMHLAAAVPTPPSSPPRRPAVVIAGGRESVPLIQYPGQKVLSNIGSLRCCLGGACWKNRAHAVGGRTRDCEQPVAVSPELTLARCMTLIEPRHVIEAIEGYLAGEADQAAFEAAKADVVRAAAMEVLPTAQACPQRDMGSDGATCACKAAPGCCGLPTARIRLAYDRCPEERFDPAETNAWKAWHAANPGA